MKIIDLFIFISTIITSIYYIINWKFISLPYYISIIDNKYNSILFLNSFIKKKNIKRYTEYEKIHTKDLKGFSLEFKNINIEDINFYKKNYFKILDYFNLLNENYDLSIYSNGKSITILFYLLPKFYTIDYAIFKNNKLFLGIYEQGFYYINFNILDHHFIAGGSDFENNNYLNLLNINFLFNLNIIESIYQVNFITQKSIKGYEQIKQIEHISNIEQLNNMLDQIIKNIIEKKKLSKYNIIVIKKLPDIDKSIYNKLSLIIEKGRKSGYILFIFDKYTDSTSLFKNKIKSKILFQDYKYSNINSQKNIYNCRAIYKNNITNNKFKVQIPHISENFLYSVLKLFKS
jgi:hypothetical protein